MRDVPGGPVVKNSPCNAGETGSIPSQETKILHATGYQKKRKKQRKEWGEMFC